MRFASDRAENQNAAERRGAALIVPDSAVVRENSFANLAQHPIGVVPRKNLGADFYRNWATTYATVKSVQSPLPS